MVKKRNSKTQPIRILAIVRWPVGGIRTYLRYVYSQLDKSQYMITILAPDIPEMQALKGSLCGPHIRYIPVSGSDSLTFSFAAIRAVARGGVDLIHSHGLTAGMTVAIIAKLLRILHIMTPHDVFTKSTFRGRFGIIRRLVLSALLPFVDVIQAVSHDAEDNFRQYFPKFGRRVSRFVTIRNGILIERFDNVVPRNFISELSLDDKHFIIGFLGRFMSQKGFRILIEAIDILRSDPDLEKIPTVVAVGSGGFIREDKARIYDKNLDQYFHFLPFEENVAATLMGLDLLVMPSLWEACPLLPMEAMIVGTPVVGTDCIGLREVLSDTPSTVVKAEDPNDLAMAIKERIRYPGRSEANKFSAEARKRFDVTLTSKKLSELYESLVSIKTGGV